MSSPRVIVQILVSGATIFGRAFLAAGRQAVKNVKHQPEGGVVGEAAGVGHANSSSPTDQLTRLHRMTLDEAQLILNVNKETPVESILKSYEHLFKANSPGPAPPKGTTTGKGAPPLHSHYLQSKVVRAKERLDAEFKLAVQEGESTAPTTSTDSPPSPPPS